MSSTRRGSRNGDSTDQDHFETPQVYTARVLHPVRPPTLGDDALARLGAVLAKEPVEAGLTHPAETVLWEACRASEASATLSRLWSEGDESARSALLRCLGRLPSQDVEALAMPLVEKALKATLIERDAAVRALEGWGTARARHALKEHENREGDEWLRTYIMRIRADR